MSIVEDAVAPGDEEFIKEGDQEDTENGSKGIKKMNDEDHVNVIVFTLSLSLRYL